MTTLDSIFSVDTTVHILDTEIKEDQLQNNDTIQEYADRVNQLATHILENVMAAAQEGKLETIYNKKKSILELKYFNNWHGIPKNRYYALATQLLNKICGISTSNLDRSEITLSWYPPNPHIFPTLLPIFPQDPQKLNNWRKQGKFCDASFTIKNVNFPIHTIILGLRSSVFEKMFFMDLKKDKVKSPINFGHPNTTPQGFELFLEYIYTEKLAFNKLCLDDLVQLAQLADLAFLIALRAECLRELEKRLLNNPISNEHCKAISQLADLINEPSLHKLTQICKNPN